MTTDNPIALFKQWLDEAEKHPVIEDATAMSLATASAEGYPSVRIVLLKGIDERGFAFYTNLESNKAHDLKENPKAALCFYWPPLGRQVRVAGAVEPVTQQEADAYFASRPRESRIGAWASRQSHTLESRMELMKDVMAQSLLFEGQEVGRPPFWSGWRLIPDAIEFWQEGAFRLHDRDLYRRTDRGWERSKLYP